MQSANNAAFENTAQNKWLSPLAFIFYFASLKLLVLMIFSGGYGYFRDELYYLACGEHLDWGYADHAPLIALIAKASRAILGESLFSIRLLPAFAGAVKILLAGLIVRELGGKRFAVILSCLCVLFSSDLAVDSFLSMNAFEGIFWMGCVLCFLLVLNRNEPRYWLIFGILAGIGLMNKHSMLFFGFSMVIGIILTKTRSQFASRWLWIGGAVAFLIFLPNLVWQWRHDWATIELLSNVQAIGKNVILSPVDFVLQQFFMMGVAGVPAWIAGLIYFLFDREGKRFRALGVAYLVFLMLMIFMKGKNYYLLPIYPMVFAGGAVYIEKLLEKMKHPGYLKFGYPAIIILIGFISAPIALPILPIDTFLQYQAAIGFQMPKTEVSFDSPLPQHFADRLGWPEMVREVAEAYHSLPPGDKAKAAIYASNFGQAGAIDFFGPKHGLPKVICPHQNYFFWGPRQYTGEIMIILGSRRENWEGVCDSIEEAGIVSHPYTMSYERYPIYICRGLKAPLSEIWPQLKFWN